MFGMTEVCTKVIGPRIKSVGRVITFGPTVESLKVNGKTIICTEKVYIHGKMDVGMKEII